MSKTKWVESAAWADLADRIEALDFADVVVAEDAEDESDE